jgi:hypothetical protein
MKRRQLPDLLDHSAVNEILRKPNVSYKITDTIFAAQVLAAVILAADSVTPSSSEAEEDADCDSEDSDTFYDTVFSDDVAPREEAALSPGELSDLESAYPSIVSQYSIDLWQNEPNLKPPTAYYGGPDIALSNLTACLALLNCSPRPQTIIPSLKAELFPPAWHDLSGFLSQRVVEKIKTDHIYATNRTVAFAFSLENMSPFFAVVCQAFYDLLCYMWFTSFEMKLNVVKNATSCPYMGRFLSWKRTVFHSVEFAEEVGKCFLKSAHLPCGTGVCASVLTRILQHVWFEDLRLATRSLEPEKKSETVLHLLWILHIDLKYSIPSSLTLELLSLRRANVAAGCSGNYWRRSANAPYLEMNMINLYLSCLVMCVAVKTSPCKKLVLSISSRTRVAFFTPQMSSFLS